MNKKELYQKAIDTWGIDAQRMVFHEEMGELLCILKGFTEGSLTEELADAIIMTEQMMFNYHIPTDVNLVCFAIHEPMDKDNILRELESNYLQLNQTMSHFHRKRTDILMLFGDLRALWGWLMTLAIYDETIGTDALKETKKAKLHRLADMLGVTYDSE